jgi:UDP-sulfoquinovose synthase
MRCVELAILNPPERGEYRVFNQLTEQFTLIDIAHRVAAGARSAGFSPSVVHVANPRVEEEEHYYSAVHTRLSDLGLGAHLLEEESRAALLELAAQHTDRVDKGLLAPKVNWRQLDNRIR